MSQMGRLVKPTRTRTIQIHRDPDEVEDMIDVLLTAAKQHGEQSEPDHEVGDLQDILRTCWKQMTPSQRRAVYAEHKELVEEWT